MFFEFGMSELMVIAVVGLLVIGPERLPEALRTIGLWLGRMRRSFVSVKAEIEKEIGMDEVKRQLHNEAVMEEMKRIEQEVQNSMNEAILDPSLNQPQSTGQNSTEQNPADQNSIEPSPKSASDLSGDAAPRPASEAELEAAHERATKRQVD